MSLIPTPGQAQTYFERFAVKMQQQQEQILSHNRFLTRKTTAVRPNIQRKVAMWLLTTADLCHSADGSEYGGCAQNTPKF